MRLKTKILISNKKFRIAGFFTIIEMVVALSVFSVVMLALMSIFGTAQEAWTRSTQRSMVYENARIALDLITRDLESAVYEDNTMPFWHYAPIDGNGDGVPDYDTPPSAPQPLGWENHALGGIAFMSNTPIPPNDESLGNHCEVMYELAYPSSDDSLRGWLRRSVTGKYLSDGSDNTKWDGGGGNFLVGYKSSPEADTSNAVDDDGDGVIDDDGAAFTCNSDSSGDWNKVIPYVTKLTFTCYNDKKVMIPPFQMDAGNAVKDQLYYVPPAPPQFPSMVRVQLSLMDKDSYKLWSELSTYKDNAFLEDKKAAAGTLGPDEQHAYEIRRASERTFTKIIFLNQ